ncbi:MAG: DUF4249 family protein [Bacteroidales bacterium]
MRKVLFLVLSLTILTVSCSEHTVSIEKKYTPQIIVEGYLLNSHPIIIRLSLSKAPDVSFEITPVLNARISLFENDVFIDTLRMIDSGLYRINWYPRNGYTYRIEVDYKNFPRITAQTFIIDESIGMSVEKIPTQYKGYESLQLKCKILDKQKNKYYGIGFFEKAFKKQFCSDPFYSDTSYHDIAIDELELPKFVEFISPTYKPGETSNFELVDFSSIQSIRTFFFNSKTMINNYFEIYIRSPLVNTVLLYSMSPEIYEFYRSIAVFNEQTESSLTAPFHTLTAIKSNIGNGLGIFGYVFTYEFQIDSVRTNCFGDLK